MSHFGSVIVPSTIAEELLIITRMSLFSAVYYDMSSPVLSPLVGSSDPRRGVTVTSTDDLNTGITNPPSLHPSARLKSVSRGPAPLPEGLCELSSQTVSRISLVAWQIVRRAPLRDIRAVFHTA